MRDQILQSIVDHYSKKLADLQTQIKEKKDDAAKSPGSMQSWSDKSKQEFTQLAEALSKNIEPLETTLKSVEEIKKTKSDAEQVTVGSIIKTISDTEDDEQLVIISGVGGEQMIVDNVPYFLLSDKSELAKQLLGKKPGDKLTLKSGMEITVSEVINK